MIYAARSLGLGSTPMICFDAGAVHREFGPEDEVPVMVLSVGPVRPGNWAQKPRRPVADLLDLVQLFEKPVTYGRLRCQEVQL
jgi:nitroreductase